jgi:uncharacterized damage-inducible protein DinB
MTPLTIFGVVTLMAMLVFYALEARSPVFILLFAGACVGSSAYGFLQGAWPFGVVEAIWTGVAFRRWRACAHPGDPAESESRPQTQADSAFCEGRSCMLEMLRDLIAHKGHANAALLTAIRENPTAASDSELWALLHHILLANRFWLLTILGLPFVHEDEARLSPSFDALVERYRRTHVQETDWLETASEGDLARILASPLIPNGTCSLSQAFMQVCLHSHGHRAQGAKLLRRHGGVPPATDFISWLAESRKKTSCTTTKQRRPTIRP